jgi:cytochrome c-type biogenesis protein
VELGNITILAAFIGGMLSFFSPCVLPLLPVFSAILAESADNTTGNLKIYSNAGCFLLGFTLVFIIMGTTASLLGQWFLDYQPEIRKAGALLIILMGFSLSGLIHFAPLEREYRPYSQKLFMVLSGHFYLAFLLRSAGHLVPVPFWQLSCYMRVGALLLRMEFYYYFFMLWDFLFRFFY